MNLSTIIKKAIDLHVHVGPEIIPRKFDITSLRRAELGRLAAIGVKNHYYPTVAMGGLKRRLFGVRIIPSVTLNESVGGLNPEAIIASAALANGPFIVWMPTISARNVTRHIGRSLPAEWFGRYGAPPAVRRNTTGIEVTNRGGELNAAAMGVLKAVQQTGAILATGHISWSESRMLVRQAIRKYGIRSVIVTHPIYQPIAMPISVQSELADLGAFMEQSFSMVAIDGISIRRITSQIQAIGSRRCILTSDVGQSYSPSPSVALRRFARLLLQQGITLAELQVMMVDNPKRLLTVTPKKKQ